jgi:hypothetical protein
VHPARHAKTDEVRDGAEQAQRGEVGGLVEGLLRALEAERDRSQQAERQVSTRLAPL